MTEEIQILEYFQRCKSSLEMYPDGSWFESNEHQLLFHSAKKMPLASPKILLGLLEAEPKLLVRFEVLRFLVLNNLESFAEQELQDFLDRACLFPLIRRRFHLLCQSRSSYSPLDLLRFECWFGEWDSNAGFIQTLLEDIVTQANGLYELEQILTEVLEENRQLTHSGLFLFQEISKIFVREQHWEGVQIFFDFLDSCRPKKIFPVLQKTVSEVLKAIRFLRPYRYPYWHRPLSKFSNYMKTLGELGRAAEAMMICQLLQSTVLEETLLLENDELVDLIRGRRDFALEDGDLLQAYDLCKAVVLNHREDARLYHILGWLSARIYGPDSAEAFFQQALNLQPDYVYSHMALASLASQKGDESLQIFHLEEACKSSTPLVSSFRQYGEILLKEGYENKALALFRKGTSCKPTESSVFELEEFFGCFVGIINVHRSFDSKSLALKECTRLENLRLENKFGIRFCRQTHSLIRLFQKGVTDLKAEIETWSA